MCHLQQVLPQWRPYLLIFPILVHKHNTDSASQRNGSQKLDQFVIAKLQGTGVWMLFCRPFGAHASCKQPKQFVMHVDGVDTTNNAKHTCLVGNERVVTYVSASGSVSPPCAAGVLVCSVRCKLAGCGKLPRLFRLLRGWFIVGSCGICVAPPLRGTLLSLADVWIRCLCPVQQAAADHA